VQFANGNGILYTYDKRDRMKTRGDALDRGESWTYYASGSVETYTDRKAQVTRYVYDAVGRMSSVTYDDGSVATATYDNGNRLRTLVDTQAGTLGWDYDDLDQLTATTSAQGNMTFAYDPAGRRSEMRAASQPVVEYRYDDGDRLRRLAQGSDVVTFDYDNAGRPSQTVLPNGVVAGYSYNPANQLTGLAWQKADGTALGELGYGYDEAGNLAAQTGSLASPALPPALAAGQQYDDANQQTQREGVAQSFDANGNLTGDGARTFVWNARNQLTQILQGASAVASFSYDAVGRRTVRNESGQATTYLYDGADPVQETRAGQVNPILTGLSPDQRFARNEASGRTYFITDGQGSTRGLTDAAGALVQRYDYTPYGEASASSSAFDNPYQYTGRELDDSGLMFYRARYYQPRHARFLSEDPLGLAAGDPNTYAYVYGNPLAYTDPLGLWAWGDPLPQWLVDGAAGFGDGVSGMATLGFYSTKDVRQSLGIDGGVRTCSCVYFGSQISGAILTTAIYARAGIPANLTHFTTAERAASIAKTGFDAGRGGFTLFGRGMYATTVGRPWNIFVPAGRPYAMGVSGEGFMRILPQLVYLKGGSFQTYAVFGGAIAGALRGRASCS